MRLLLWEKGFVVKRHTHAWIFPDGWMLWYTGIFASFLFVCWQQIRGFFTLIFNWSHPFAFCVFALDTVKSFWLLLKIQPPSTCHLQLKLSRDWVLPILFRETTEIPLLSLDTQELTNHNGSHKKEQIDT